MIQTQKTDYTNALNNVALNDVIMSHHTSYGNVYMISEGRYRDLVLKAKKIR